MKAIAVFLPLLVATTFAYPAASSPANAKDKTCSNNNTLANRSDDAFADLKGILPSTDDSSVHLTTSQESKYKFIDADS